MARVANLDDRVREELRQQILTGELNGGAHLSELKLSKEFDVSRTPVREALCALAADGLIEMIPHRGAFVREFSSNTQADQYTAYSLFMANAGYLAAEKGEIEATMNLEQTIAALSEVKGKSSEQFVDALTNVVQAIMAAANNSMVDSALEMVHNRTNMSEFWQASSSVQEQIANDFQVFMGAVKRGKSDVAEKTLRQICQTIAGQTSTMQNADQAAQQLATETVQQATA